MTVFFFLLSYLLIALFSILLSVNITKFQCHLTYNCIVHTVYFNCIGEFKFYRVKHKTNSGDISEQTMCSYRYRISAKIYISHFAEWKLFFFYRWARARHRFVSKSHLSSLFTILISSDRYRKNPIRKTLTTTRDIRDQFPIYENISRVYITFTRFHANLNL